MRTFAIGDIHGGLQALLQVLNKLELTEKDELIFMGDYVDGWSESAQTIDFLIDLSQKFNCTFIKGNHDIWCENWLEKAEVNPSWYMHGGKATLDSYEGFTHQQKQIHLAFFKQMKMYVLDNQNRLFVHAGFTSLHGVDKEPSKLNFCIDRTLWEMVLALDLDIDTKSLFYPKRLQHYTEIFIGHTPTTNYEISIPMQIANVWNVDTGAAFKGKISALNIETKAFFQSDDLPSLYPNEKGRN